MVVNSFSKELCWTVRRYYPLAISLILLGIAVKNIQAYLPVFLESGHVTTIQIIITGVVIYLTHCEVKKIKNHLQSGTKPKNRISFLILVIFSLIAEAFGNVIATNIFLLNLFALVAMPENSFREFLLSINDYVLGLLIFPLLGWNSFRGIRKSLSWELEECACSKVVSWNQRNWLVPSLVILISLNVILVFTR